MNSTLKQCAEMITVLLATELELRLKDIIKENLPNWRETTLKERQQICQSIGRYWLEQFKGE